MLFPQLHLQRRLFENRYICQSCNSCDLFAFFIFSFLYFSFAGRLVSIAVTPATRSCGNEALVLNHINTPNVFIWSAVTASCSLPGLLPPHELMVRSTNGSPVPYCHPGRQDCYRFGRHRRGLNLLLFLYTCRYKMGRWINQPRHSSKGTL